MGQFGAGTPGGSVLGPVSFLIYIDRLCKNLASNFNLCAHNTSLFPVGKNIDASGVNLNNDLNKVSDSAF